MEVKKFNKNFLYGRRRWGTSPSSGGRFHSPTRSIVFPLCYINSHIGDNDLILADKHYIAQLFNDATAIGFKDLSDHVPGWPNNTYEQWAYDYHRRFFTTATVNFYADRYQLYADVIVYGVPNLPNDEYIDSYEQMQVMAKLESNL